MTCTECGIHYDLVMFNNIGSTEVLVLVLLLVVLFGGSKVSELARGMGEAAREFKKAQKEMEEAKEELKKEVNTNDGSVIKKKKFKKKHKKL